MHNPAGRELEVKLYLLHPGALQARLEEMGARLVTERVHEMNLRFDTPDRSLSAAGQVLRLRQDDRVRLTYKSPPQAGTAVSDREELELEVGDLELMRRLLEALGYQVAMRYEKYRTTWQVQGCEVTLDEMPYGDFCEVEGQDAASIQAVVDALGLRWERRVLASYLAIFDLLRAAGAVEARELLFTSFGLEKPSWEVLAGVQVLPADA